MELGLDHKKDTSLKKSIRTDLLVSVNNNQRPKIILSSDVIPLNEKLFNKNKKIFIGSLFVIVVQFLTVIFFNLNYYLELTILSSIFLLTTPTAIYFLFKAMKAPVVKP